MTYENVLRASGVVGVMAHPFYTTEEETTLFKSVPLLDARMAWYRHAWCGSESTCSRLRGEREARAARN